MAGDSSTLKRPSSVPSMVATCRACAWINRNQSRGKVSCTHTSHCHAPTLLHSYILQDKATCSLSCIQHPCPGLSRAFLPCAAGIEERSEQSRTRCTSIMARRWPRQSRGPPAKGMNVCVGLVAPALSAPSTAAAASVAALVAVHLGAAVSRASACMHNLKCEHASQKVLACNCPAA